MSAKTDKAEIVQRINDAVKSAGLPELPFDLLHKADAITLNLFYDRWLTVALVYVQVYVQGRTREIERQLHCISKQSETTYVRPPT